ncbi:MAG TPA: hypothetical protein VET66_03565, partial [Steroidobacteraceae bacterium]|nr:hypothetical protein [Steroidobacteraceae bacterium]
DEARLALRLDLLQFLFLGGFGPLAARPAELHRLFRLRCSRGRLRAIGLDHHQAGAVEQLLRIDARCRLRGTRLFAPRFVARLMPRLVAWFVLRRLGGDGRLHSRFLHVRSLGDARSLGVLLLALRLELVNAPLGFDDRRITHLLVLARTVAAVAVASTAIAAATALLIPLAGFARLLITGLLIARLLLVARLLIGEERLTLLHRVLLRTRLLLLSLALLVTLLSVAALAVALMLLAAVPPLAVALLSIPLLTVAPLLQASLLLPVA